MKTVLVADSDTFQRQLIDMLLAVDDYKIIGVETGRQVLEYLQSNVPDIAILDYSLPDINGADLCAKIRGVKRLSKVPVILVTSAHKLTLVKGIAVAVKANAVLSKPLGDKKLREQVQALVKSSKSKPVLPEAIPLTMDPYLEQALDHLPHLTQSHDTLQVIQPSDLPQVLENPNHDIIFAESLPPLEIADLIDTQSLQDTPLPQLFQSDTLDLEPSLPSGGVFSPLDFQAEYADTGSISEQELLDSLEVRVDEPAFNHSFDSDPSFDTEPQVYRLAPAEPETDLVTPQQSSYLSQPIPSYTSLEILKDQVEQLGGENEQLKITLRELDSGHPLHASRSYLDAIEELEMLRRLTGIQSKQLNEIQKHNQSLIDEVQLLKTQRRSGFFGFRSGKKADRDSA